MHTRQSALTTTPAAAPLLPCLSLAHVVWHAAGNDAGCTFHPDQVTSSTTGATCHGQGSAAILGDDLVAGAVAAAGIVASPHARVVAERCLESPLRPPVPQRA